MTKKGFKMVLLTIYSTVILSACGGGKTELEDKSAERYTEIENTNTASEITESEKSKTGLSVEIDYNWYQGKWYRGTSDPSKLFWIKDGKVNCTRYIGELDSFSTEEIENESVGAGIRYFFQWKKTDGTGKEYFDIITIEYYPTVDRVIITELDNMHKTKDNCSDVYEYDKNLTNTMLQAKDSTNKIVEDVLYDGQRFECFETVSEEDIILTIHLFYTDGSETPSSYKGELSNGVEFWFEPYASSSESVTYKVDCNDGTKAYLEYAVNTSEIAFTADEGAEYGNMYAYSGTYIGLPDEEQIEYDVNDN